MINKLQGCQDTSLGRDSHEKKRMHIQIVALLAGGRAWDVLKRRVSRLVSRASEDKEEERGMIYDQLM